MKKLKKLSLDHLSEVVLNERSANDAGNPHSDDCTQPEPEQGSICYIEPERQDALCCMTQYTCL